MTYCLAMRLSEGLIFLSDTRTNAGVDNVGSYGKMHIIEAGDDRRFVLMSAGNLATTQQVLDLIDRDLETEGVQESLATVGHMFEAALYVGRLNQSVVREHQGALGSGAAATFILGGQIHGERPRLHLVYAEGNYIRPSDERPFLQIGETKYGLLMLELAVRARVDIDKGIKVALSSMVSTARSNLSVGPPYDLAVYRNGSMEVQQHRIEAGSPYLEELSTAWLATLTDGIGTLPPLPRDLID